MRRKCGKKKNRAQHAFPAQSFTRVQGFLLFAPRLHFNHELNNVRARLLDYLTMVLTASKLSLNCFDYIDESPASLTMQLLLRDVELPLESVKFGSETMLVDHLDILLIEITQYLGYHQSKIPYKSYVR
jgi:hypothetical protein